MKCQNLWRQKIDFDRPTETENRFDISYKMSPILSIHFFFHWIGCEYEKAGLSFLLYTRNYKFSVK